MRPLLLFRCLLALPLAARQRTTFTPGGPWPDTDGNPIDAHGGTIIYVDSLRTYYWYGERYAEPRGAACYSSTDLYNWTFGGVAMKKGAIGIFERPKVIHDLANDRYVLWFHYDGDRYSIAELGVAVSDSPTGPFTLVDHYRPHGHESRDIGLYFAPDTRTAYIGYAADHVNRTVRMVELADDYLRLTPTTSTSTPTA